MFKAKVKHLEQGEKCSRFFFKKLCREKGVLEGVYGEDGSVCKSDEVLEHVTKFYENLYKGVYVDESNETVLGMVECNLSKEDQGMLQSEV